MRRTMRADRSQFAGYDRTYVQPRWYLQAATLESFLQAFPERTDRLVSNVGPSLHVRHVERYLGKLECGRTSVLLSATLGSFRKAI